MRPGSVGLRGRTAARHPWAMAGRPRRPHVSIPHRLAAAGCRADLLGLTVGRLPPPTSRRRTRATTTTPRWSPTSWPSEAAKPSIVDVFSIGKSHQGRDIWAAKISDNVEADENEPEVLFDALHHAREHMTVEQALYLLHLLADNYDKDTTITNLVNNREILIVFMLNPDGAEYDLTGRQPRPVLRLAQEPPAELQRLPATARTSTGTTATSGPAAAGRPAARRRSPTAAVGLLGARDPRASATSSTAGSRTASSRSGPTSRSTPTAS